MNSVLFFAVIITVTRSLAINAEHFPIEPCYGIDCDIQHPNRDFYNDARNKLIDKELSELSIKLANSHASEDYGGDSSNSDDLNDPKAYTSRVKYSSDRKPSEDQVGWVTMEAVPWSVSKISKWQPNATRRPSRPTWAEDPVIETYGGPISHGNTYKKKPSIWNQDPYEEEPNEPALYTWSSNDDDVKRPKPSECKDKKHKYPSYRPESSAAADLRLPFKPYIEQHSMQRPLRRPTEVTYSLDDSRGSSQNYHEINEDQNGPAGDGQWVLLSTTKGFQSPKRKQRSMVVTSSPMRIHRSLKLTVLPLEDGKRNMTTSHGGLLEVERSFKSVDEAKKEADRKRVSFKTGNIVTPIDSSSVYAAVGAGMVPATMAMVFPALFGKKRRRRDLFNNGIKRNPDDLIGS